MFPRPIDEIRVHPAQLAALKAAGFVYDANLLRPQPVEGSTAPEPALPQEWVTVFDQVVRVSKYLPEEGLFLPGSKAAREAEKTEAGDVRRREAHKRYRENFGT